MRKSGFFTSPIRDAQRTFLFEPDATIDNVWDADKVLFCANGGPPSPITITVTNALSGIIENRAVTITASGVTGTGVASSVNGPAASSVTILSNASGLVTFWVVFDPLNYGDLTLTYTCGSKVKTNILPISLAPAVAHSIICTPASGTYPPLNIPVPLGITVYDQYGVPGGGGWLRATVTSAPSGCGISTGASGEIVLQGGNILQTTLNEGVWDTDLPYLRFGETEGAIVLTITSSPASLVCTYTIRALE